VRVSLLKDKTEMDQNGERDERKRLGGDSPLSKWRVHLLKGQVRTAVSEHLQRFGE
jgi:hypothetical protein